MWHQESPKSSGTLSSFASGGWYADTAGCFLQGDVRTKVKTLGTGKNMVEEAVQTSTMERLCKLLHGEAVQTPLSPVQSHAWSPTKYLHS
jgi:hypothetical protein